MEIEAGSSLSLKDKAPVGDLSTRSTGGQVANEFEAPSKSGTATTTNVVLSDRSSTEFELIPFNNGAGSHSESPSRGLLTDVDDSELCSQSADDYVYLGTSQSCTSVLSDQLSERIGELHLLSETLSKKEKEIDHLRHVIKDLTQARQRVNGVKHELSRRYSMLQDQFDRAVRATQLAQTVSRQNICKVARTRRQLSATEDELARSKKQNAALREKNKKLKAENAELKQKLAVLEKLNFYSDCRQSLVMKELGFSREIGLY